LDFFLFFSNSFNDMFSLSDLKEKEAPWILMFFEGKIVGKSLSSMFLFYLYWNKCQQKWKIIFFNEKSILTMEFEMRKELDWYSCANITRQTSVFCFVYTVVICIFYETVLLSNTLSWLHMMLYICTLACPWFGNRKKNHFYCLTSFSLDLISWLKHFILLIKYK